MSLTQQNAHKDPDAFPYRQLFILALVRFSEPIALTSIFPYAWKLVLNFKVGDESEASLYAGILIAAFALAESFTGYLWGSISDKIGRKPVVILGCAGTILSLLLVGFSSTFWVALLGRIVGGLLNGNGGVVQCCLGELVRKKEHEAKIYSVGPFVWTLGSIFGAAIGGFFSEPVVNFPNIFSKGGLFDRFPYLLPNVVCSAILLAAIIIAVFFLEETHEDFQPWIVKARPRSYSTYTECEQPVLPVSGGTYSAAADLRAESYGTFNNVDRKNHNIEAKGSRTRPASVSSFTGSKVLSRPILMLTLALGIYTYHAMSYEILFPILLQDARPEKFVSSSTSVFSGGLGLSTQDVGIIMSLNGFIALFVQGVVFPAMTSWLGVWRLFILVAIGSPICYLMMPFLTLIPGANSPAVYAGIYGCLTIRNFFNIITYPLLLILLKEASPGPKYLGKINGLAASVGAACRTLASPLSGELYSVGSQMNFCALPWYFSAAVATAGAIQVLFMSEPHGDQTSVNTFSRFVDDEEAHLVQPSGPKYADVWDDAE